MNSIKHLCDKTLLVILDGFGINPTSPKNAIEAAIKPNLDKLFSEYPYTLIKSGGVEVGLPNGVAGNSEVGHLNLGSGKPVTQDLVRINEAISQDTLKTMPELLKIIQHVKNANNKIHLKGLLSDGSIHSHIDHIKSFIEIFKNHGIKIFFHAYMDGRDTPITNGLGYIKELKSLGGFEFASMQGRSIGMDRDRRWEKIELAYKTFIGQGAITDLSPEEYIKKEYDNNITDEFITPVLFNKESAITNHDTVFFLNFRPDRAKQITTAFMDPKFDHFKRDVVPNYFLCLTPYVDEELPEIPILFDKEKIKGGLSDHLSSIGKKQFKIAETEKFAHVTYFFNGGEQEAFIGEDRLLIPSPREVKTYDEKPQMSAYEVCDNLVKKIKEAKHDFYLVNFANPDMVGHTGNYEAAIKAIEAVDECVGKLMDVCDETDTTLILTADHGNSDQMVYSDGSPHTSHTSADVPFVVYNQKIKNLKFELTPGDHALKDVSPTVLYTLGLEFPSTFEGTNIFK